MRSWCQQESEWRLKNLSVTNILRDVWKMRSDFGKKIENWIDRKCAYSGNALHLATECSNKEHNAFFPEAVGTGGSASRS